MHVHNKKAFCDAAELESPFDDVQCSTPIKENRCEDLKCDEILKSSGPASKKNSHKKSNRPKARLTQKCLLSDFNATISSVSSPDKLQPIPAAQLGI